MIRRLATVPKSRMALSQAARRGFRVAATNWRPTFKQGNLHSGSKISMRWCSEPAAAEDIKKTPVTVITGFLGAGKTTLLNRILRNKEGKKYAVIENEIGDIGIDDILVHKEQIDGEDSIFELNNGCLCCTVRDDLIEILSRLQHRNLDAIIVETTGLADPSPIVQTFMLQENYALDGIVTVVDAKNVLNHLQETSKEHTDQEEKESTNEVVSQIAFADRIILNKMDLITEEEKQTALAEIRNINSMAKIREAERSNVDLDFVIDIDGFNTDRAVLLLDELKAGHDHDHDHHHDHGHDHHDHHHHHHHHHDHITPAHNIKHGVSTVSFHVSKEMNPAGLSMFIDNILERYSTSLYRYKGVLAVVGCPDKLVLQGVPFMKEGPYPLAPWGEDEKRETRMIFIGKGLDKPLLQNGFDRCVAPENLRFAVGDSVKCKIAADVYAAGNVVAHWDHGYPYRVKLEAMTRDGHDEVWAPFDEDTFIEKA